MTDATEKKKAWRRLAAGMFALTGREERRALDRALCERLREYVFESGARCLLGFAPLPDEPDVSPFLARWAAEGGCLLLPVWLGGREMRFRRVDDFSVQLRPGRGGILEPVEQCAEMDASAIDLCLTPGRLFSERCDRLGRGAGCYDSLIERAGIGTVGIAYDFQVFPVLPVDAGDRPVDAVLTPGRLLTRHG